MRVQEELQEGPGGAPEGAGGRSRGVQEEFQKVPGEIPTYQNTKGSVSQNWVSTRGVLASFFPRGGLSRVEPQF